MVIAFPRFVCCHAGTPRAQGLPDKDLRFYCFQLVVPPEVSEMNQWPLAVFLQNAPVRAAWKF